MADGRSRWRLVVARAYVAGGERPPLGDGGRLSVNRKDGILCSDHELDLDEVKTRNQKGCRERG